MRIESNSVFTAWAELLRAVMNNGHVCYPRGDMVKELIGTQMVVSQLRNNIIVHPYRDLNYKFMVAEWLWILAGDNKVETIAKFNKQIKAFSDDGETFAGAYGPRLRPQLEYVVKTLKADPDSRQAVATIFSPMPEPSKDIPCSVALQVLIREGKLHGVFTMRSNDLWLGAPYDFFNFSQICNWLADRVGAETGSLTFQAGSSHIYAKDFDGALKVVMNQKLGSTLSSPPIRSLAPSAIWPEDNTKGHTWAENLYRSVLDSKGKAEALTILRGPQQDK